MCETIYVNAIAAVPLKGAKVSSNSSPTRVKTKIFEPILNGKKKNPNLEEGQKIHLETNSSEITIHRKAHTDEPPMKKLAHLKLPQRTHLFIAVNDSSIYWLDKVKV